MTHRSLSAAVLAAATLTTALAFADPTDADRATARLLAQEGQDALDHKDYAVAADRFGRADAMVHAPTLLLALARSRAGLGQLVAAQEAYSRIVREGVPAGAPPVFFKALDSARDELEALTARIPSVTIEVKGPPSPNVTLDGVAVPSAALGAKRAVDPGTHSVRAEGEGFTPAETKFTVAEGKTERVTLELARAAVAPPKAALVPIVPPRPVTAPPPPVAPVPPVAPASARHSARWTAGVAALGIGGAGLVLGGVTGALFLGRRSDLQGAGCAAGVCPASQQANLSDYHLFGTLSTVGFIVAGAGAATGAILILTAPKAGGAPRASERLAAVLGPTYAGVEGSFP